jgi:hypothetical protein
MTRRDVARNLAVGFVIGSVLALSASAVVNLLAWLAGVLWGA